MQERLDNRPAWQTNHELDADYVGDVGLDVRLELEAEKVRVRLSHEFGDRFIKLRPAQRRILMGESALGLCSHLLGELML